MENPGQDEEYPRLQRGGYAGQFDERLSLCL